MSGDGWRDIEDGAPKDGSQILVWDRDVADYEIARWSARHERWVIPLIWAGDDVSPRTPEDVLISCTVYIPTRWRPLPDPPTEDR